MAVRGVKEMTRNLKRASKVYRKLAGKGLASEGERLRALAVDLTPVQTGFLRGSAFVNDPKESGSGAKVTVGYTAPYATSVHERTEVSRATGQPKFLSAALRALRRNYLGNLAKALNSGIRNVRFTT